MTPAQHPEASPRRTLGRGRNHASLGPGTNKEPFEMKEGQGVKLTKLIASYVFVAYMAVGGVLGSMLYASIPAMNVLGWGYYALTWPAFVCHGTKVCSGAPYVPSWSFTFPTAGRAALEQPQ
jgi:hypothetical protein